MPLLRIPSIPGNPPNSVAAYKQLRAIFSTKSANQTLLTFIRKGQVQTVTMLARAIRLHRGGAMAAYRAVEDYLDIKRHGIWSSDAFWAYIMAPDVSTLLVARGSGSCHFCLCLNLQGYLSIPISPT